MATSNGAGASTMASADMPNAGVPGSSSVEMNNLTSTHAAAVSPADATAGAQEAPAETSQPEASTPAAQETPNNTAETPADPQANQPEGLGPATDLPVVAPVLSPIAGPTLAITLMLTTGARHPYKIDEKYLKNRKVDAVGQDGAFDPREISGYQLKELIWTDWRSEWEPRPASPSSIRLIILGRLLEDKSPLKDSPFRLDNPNVVHMTVKPADFLDDDDTAAKGTGKGHSIRGRDDGEGSAGCRCVIL